MYKILVLHGPNLNLLGKREPGIYGTATLSQIDDKLQQLAKTAKIELNCFQSNAEHELINQIQQASDDSVNFILINPAAYTHTSIALRDAFLATQIPFIEVHLSDPNQREDFRKRSYLSDIAVTTVADHGAESYYIALKEAIKHINNKPE